MPELSVLLQGSPLRTDVGVVGFCSVVLIEGDKRILVDVGHVGRRTALENALKARGLTPEDIDITIMSTPTGTTARTTTVPACANAGASSGEKYAHKPHRNDWATPAWSGAMIEFQPQVQEVEEGQSWNPGLR